MNNAVRKGFFKAAGLQDYIKTAGQYDGSFYLTFCYEGVENVDSQHITHTYFGKLSGTDLAKVLELCNLYFKANPFQGFEVCFDRVEMFGKEKDMRVLRPGYPVSAHSCYLPKLSCLLNPYNASAFKDELFKAHTTSSESVVGGRIDRIAIMSGNSVIGEWSE